MCVNLCAHKYIITLCRCQILLRYHLILQYHRVYYCEHAEILE